MTNEVNGLKGKVGDLQGTCTVGDLMKEISNIKEAMVETERRNERRFKEHEKASNGYLNIRSRFIDFFKRDILGEITWSTQIEAGNSSAHDGESVMLRWTRCYMRTR
jgi:hypothetical protein